MREKISIFFLSILTSLNIIGTPTAKPAPVIFAINENILWDKVNDWELKQGFQPYIKDDALCSLASSILPYVNSWSVEYLNFNKPKYPYTSSTWNTSKNYYSEESILINWTTNTQTLKNLKDIYIYACIKCEEYNCVQLFANKRDNILNTTANNQNVITNTQSTDANLVDCVGPDGKVFQTTMTQCVKFNNDWNRGVDYLIDCNCNGKISRMPLSHCNQFKSYGGCGGNTINNQTLPKYNYTVPTFALLPTWAPFSTFAPLPTYNYSTHVSNSTTTTINTSACYSQYSADTQAANMLGG